MSGYLNCAAIGGFWLLILGLTTPTPTAMAQGGTNSLLVATPDTLDFGVVTVNSSPLARRTTKLQATDNFAVFITSITVAPQRRGNVQQPVQVRYQLSGSSSNSIDYRALPLTATIAAGQSQLDIDVVAINDNLPEGNETVTLTAINDTSAPPQGFSAYSVVPTAAVASVQIIDDDFAGIRVVPTGGLTTTEAGGTATFTVELDTLVAASVTIGLSSSDPGEGTVSPAQLTFSSSASGARTVTVTGVDDTIADGAQSYRIVTVPALSPDPNYSGRNAADVIGVECY